VDVPFHDAPSEVWTWGQEWARVVDAEGGLAGRPPAFIWRIWVDGRVNALACG
jgi:hypothetical protein